MKRFLSVILVLVLSLSVIFTGCNKDNQNDGGDTTDNGTVTDNNGDKDEDTNKETTDELLKVGMATDSGSIDDKSFNQGTWEGILQYEQEKGTIETYYIQPSGEQHADYVMAIEELISGGYEVIVTPGFKFETAVYESASNHPDIKYILIDGRPMNPETEQYEDLDNVVAVFFNEHEAGFLAGVAAALSTETGKLGFIGGMEIPAPQRFGWGYQAGVDYANKNLGTNAEITKYVFQGTFYDVAGGQQLAAGMYNDGIDIIYHAAGGVGVGIFNEAKERAQKGEKVYVIGVDSDQYQEGVIPDGTSVALTSSLKRVDVAAYDYIDAAIKGEFPGGQVITLALSDNAVGVPEENPNLNEETLNAINTAIEAVVNGDVKVPSTEEELKAYLGE